MSLTQIERFRLDIRLNLIWCPQCIRILDQYFGLGIDAIFGASTLGQVSDVHVLPPQGLCFFRVYSCVSAWLSLICSAVGPLLLDSTIGLVYADRQCFDVLCWFDSIFSSRINSLFCLLFVYSALVYQLISICWLIFFWWSILIVSCMLVLDHNRFFHAN